MRWSLWLRDGKIASDIADYVIVRWKIASDMADHAIVRWKLASDIADHVIVHWKNRQEYVRLEM